MKVKYFGTDGIRGKSYEKLNAKLAFNLGNSLKETFESKKIVIGHDTRNSSPMLAYMVASGALMAGLDVLYAGVVPTPLIAYYSKLKQITGIMITASHNPYQDNGIKVFNKGYKTKIEEELIIEKYIDGEKKLENDFGSLIETDDVLVEYLKLIESLNIPNSNIKVLYDSANGANYLLSNELMTKYFTNSVQISNEPDGKNINLNCGSTHLDYLKSKMNSFEVGFSYDGDGDRVLMIGANNKVYDGDMIIYILATYLKNKNLLKNNKVVLTKMSNPGILKALKRKGISYILTDVGDKYVYEALENNDLVLGGEASGHIIFRSLLDTGDGLLISLYILKILKEMNLDLISATKDINLYPFKMINIKDVNKLVLKEEKVINYLNNYQKTLKEDDLMLIRPSGTENLIRVTLSMEDETKLENDINMLVNYLKKEGEKL